MVKSAYEIALERLEKEHGPVQTLSDDQRRKIAEIDKRYDSQIAEERLKLDGRLSQATSAEEVEQIRAESAENITSLEAKREKEKEAVWNAN